ncbi:hypothetical protein [Candidatus Methylacidiphilum infernorum]|uniref:Uncharacterized protein n=1 Tax=Methylacidiphilum infernorum (isolate V4) TaxID=481448 RepID=B3DXH7_METI4|nr:hypothetical protein [Candidatus Methylacidiphilum infernorum]ACD82211.1 Hypothetical protein Minf_0151 [Methylacidiphilum infernorum V4]
MDWVQTVTIIVSLGGFVFYLFRNQEKRIEDLRSDMNVRFAEQGKRIELVEKILAKAVRIDPQTLD